jgi:hypothetical protein
MGQFTDNDTPQFGADASGAIPEPSTWAMLLIGFGAIGATMRRKRQRVTYSIA